MDETRDVLQGSQIKAEIVDLHVWRVGQGKYACTLSLVATSQVDPSYLKRQLSMHEELMHIAIEVNDRSAAPR